MLKWDSYLLSDPYHSKYNPIERVWGVLEQHWNGSLLDTKDAVIRFAQTMKWNGKNPIVNLVEKCYQTGVSLTQKAMAQIEKRLERLEGLESGLQKYLLFRRKRWND